MFAELFNTILAKVYLKSVASESKILNDKLHLLKKNEKRGKCKKFILPSILNHIYNSYDTDSICFHIIYFLQRTMDS